MIKGILVAAALGAVVVAPAQAERRSAGQELGSLLSIAANEFLAPSGGTQIEQVGDRNQAARAGSGVASLYQKGYDQKAQMVQDGSRNRMDVSQYGLANTARVDQPGSGNYACLIQMGVALDGRVVQSGKGSRAGVLQTQAGDYEISPTACFLEKVGRTYVAQRQARG